MYNNQDRDPQTPTNATPDNQPTAPNEPQNSNTAYQPTGEQDLRYAYKPSDDTVQYAYDAPPTKPTGAASSAAPAETAGAPDSTTGFVAEQNADLNGETADATTYGSAPSAPTADLNGETADAATADTTIYQSAPSVPRGGEYARANGYAPNTNYHYEPTAGGYGTNYSAGGFASDTTTTYRGATYGSATDAPNTTNYSAPNFTLYGAAYDPADTANTTADATPATETGGGYGGNGNGGDNHDYTGYSDYPTGEGYGRFDANSASHSDSHDLTAGHYGAGGSTYGGSTYGGANSTNNYGPYAYAGRAAKAKKPKQSMNITRRAFVLILILCMLLTSGVTVGGFALWDHYHNNGGGNTYTLTSSKETLSYKSIIEMNENSVVSITTESVTRDAWAQNYVTTGAGSGIVISKDGYIMTCAHVVSGSSKITVTLANDKSFDAELVGQNSNEDIAVLKIKATGLDPVTIGDSSALSVGDQVVAIGNPLGSLSGTATTGIISALERTLTIEGKTLNLLQTDASINPGNSGGALFNAQGELIGVVVAKSTGSDVEGLGFAIPVNKAKSVADDLIENGSPASESSQSSSSSSSNESGNSNGSDSEQSDHGKIGVLVSQLTEDAAEQAGFNSGAGLYIVQITSQNAKEAGLQAGDRIVSCNGTSVSSHSELQTILEKTKAGDKATIGILRNGTSKTITVTLS